MLTVIIYSKHDPKTKRAGPPRRATAVAMCRLATLLFIGSRFTVSADKIIFVRIAAMMFLLTEEMLHNGIDNDKYRKIFGMFLFGSGILLIIKSLKTWREE